MNNARDTLIQALRGNGAKVGYMVVGYNNGVIHSVSRFLSPTGTNIFIVGYAENFNVLYRSEQQKIVERDEARKDDIIQALERALQDWLKNGKPVT